MKKSILIILLIVFIITFGSAFAQTPEVTNGLNYLTSTQNPDGSWGNETSSTEPLPATVSVIETLQILNETSSQNYADAVLWLQSQTLDTTDYLSERIHALSDAGTDLDVVISYFDGIYTGAWGGYEDFGTNNLDTALAVLALNEINYTDLDTISYALFYLTNNQNSDGGWGFTKGDDASTGTSSESQSNSSAQSSSNVYMTALVLQALNVFSSTFNVKSSIDNAVAYLLSKQNPDGAISTDASTIFETAIALDALITFNADISTIAQSAIDYLINNQLPNGSWNDDPYSTALAIRALSNVKPNLTISSGDITFSDPAPTVGDTITITATIHNEGPAIAEDVLVEFYNGDPLSGGVLISETTILTIPAYGIKLSKFNFDNFLRNKGLFIKQRWHLKWVVSAFLGATSLIDMI